MSEVTFKGLLFKGGFLAATLYVLYLSRNNRISRLMVPTSYFFTFLSMFGMIAGQGNGSEEDDDPDYENRMAEFYRLRPMLEAALREQAQLMYDYEKSRLRTDEVHRMRDDFAAIRRRIEEMQPRWQAAVPRQDHTPLLISTSFESVVIIARDKVRPARAASMENRPRRYSSSDAK